MISSDPSQPLQFCDSVFTNVCFFENSARINFSQKGSPLSTAKKKKKKFNPVIRSEISTLYSLNHGITESLRFYDSSRSLGPAINLNYQVLSLVHIL